MPTLRWYTFDERSGAFAQAAQDCGAKSGVRVELALLPADADQQRELCLLYTSDAADE